MFFSIFVVAHPAVYALPGSPHALVSESSLDSFRQSALQNTVVQNKVSGVSSGTTALPTITDDADEFKEPLSQQPFAFISDTDSVKYLIDSGANRFIVNNPKLLINFIATDGNVKGISGSPVSIRERGTHTLHLASNKGVSNVITVTDAVYVPTSPFNLLPPQMLVSALWEDGYSVDYFKHNHEKYLIEYAPKGGKPSDSRTLTVPINGRNLFTFRSKAGYTDFMCMACTYDPSWSAFPGSSHAVSNSDDEESSNFKFPATRKEETRERHVNLLKTREPTTVPFSDSDFTPRRPVPWEAKFERIISPEVPAVNVEMEMIRQKQ